MNDEQYLELTGRLQGLTDIVVLLIAHLGNRNLLRIDDFVADMDRLAIARTLDPELLKHARDLITDVADLLDEVENQRPDTSQ